MMLQISMDRQPYRTVRKCPNMCKTDTGIYITWVPMQIEAQEIHREISLQVSGIRKYFLRIRIRGFGILNYGSG
jgi:hypothetical protein